MMAEEQKCNCGNTGVMLYTCAGGTNLGHISYDVVNELVAQGKGKMGCLCGIGGHISTMVLNAKAAKMIIMVDGCRTRCGAKTLEQAGITDFEQVFISDFDIKKTYDLSVGKEKKDQIVRSIIEEKLSSDEIDLMASDNGGSCCGDI